MFLLLPVLDFPTTTADLGEGLSGCQKKPARKATTTIHLSTRFLLSQISLQLKLYLHLPVELQNFVADLQRTSAWKTLNDHVITTTHWGLCLFLNYTAVG